MPPRALTLLALATALTACPGGDETVGARGPRPPVLAGVPSIQGSRIVDTTGTAEAARVSLLTSWPVDSVAAFYRRELAARGWRLVGDVKETDRVDLYAERDGPPLWVRIRNAGAGVTQYTLIAAEVRPGARDTLRP